ncbi:uncharacterized protein si:dkey-96g2.1 [Triplophysa dalaica]|uniref:uncharacterized protein si:dkey-96g2.1 n=1 Tax=Triplophysa dalaica TaxID=1582913 RepID=UPI0024DF8BBF|nr:uncharacterized protein si:dkey-96g2.1 [Triplophysa dalaica]
MTSVELLRALLFLCLLHRCVQADVNTAVLSKMITYFDNNVKPDTTMDVDPQYAMAINVPKEQCTVETSNIETVFSREEAATVKSIIINKTLCELCTNSQNVIATRPLSRHAHAEHILLYPTNNSSMDKLLRNANANSCVVFYSCYSPCVNRCINGENNILEGLSNWKNKHGGMNVFVFTHIWTRGQGEKNLAVEFQKIDEIVPLYRCYGVEHNCIKCGDNNNMIQPACLN